VKRIIIFFCRMCRKPYVIFVDEEKIRSIAKSSDEGIATITTIHFTASKPHLVKLHIDEYGTIRGDYYETIDVSDIFAWSVSADVQKHLASIYALIRGGNIIEPKQVSPEDDIERIISTYLRQILGNVRICRRGTRMSIETDLDEIDELTRTIIEIILTKIIEKCKNKRYVLKYIGGNIEITTT